ncbi:MAG: molybdenum cofactor guanylyltransferase [Acidobacteriota bacterium]|nr:molybdenum cofactor guanylyltransferase [Acidobacteriota bacterium]
MASDAKSTIRAFIQAGGRSSRMGADKAWLSVVGHPMIEHVLAAAEPVAASLSIIISADNPNAKRYCKLAEGRGARLLDDLHDHLGPLGGIHTALNNCEAGDAALILACDLPFLTSEFLALLCQKHQSGEAQITVPLDAEGRPQPLVAIYKQSCLLMVEEQLATGRLRVDRLFDVFPTTRIAYSGFAHLPGAAQFFRNLNSPGDYQDALRPDCQTRQPQVN